MSEPEYTLQPIGHVESPLRLREEAPKQGDEGAPEAWLVFDEAIEGLRIRVRDLEALDGTPILDVKPPLGRVEER